MNGSTTSVYAEKFGQVFDYIDKHLDEELSVARLSRVANFSKLHFHRQFCEYSGITVFRYVQMMRLKRACYRIVFSGHSRIIDIALEASFEKPKSFSRAFKNAFRQTPTQFRKKPAWKPWNEQYRTPIKNGTSTCKSKLSIPRRLRSPHWNTVAHPNW
jgi:AraC family transcriptional regulator